MKKTISMLLALALLSSSLSSAVFADDDRTTNLTIGTSLDSIDEVEEYDVYDAETGEWRTEPVMQYYDDDTENYCSIPARR